jgi:hypothetical protein
VLFCVNFEKEVDEFDEQVAVVEALADIELDAELDIFVRMLASCEHVFHGFDVVGSTIDLELKPEIGESCFVDI